MRITADEKTVFEGMVSAGEERTWSAKHSIAFRCGNAGGVVITINDQKLGTLGERGQVVDQTWIIEEQQISAAPTPSP